MRGLSSERTSRRFMFWTVAASSILPVLISAPAFPENPPTAAQLHHCDSCAPVEHADEPLRATGLGLLFDTTDFPQRWYCGTWSLTHGWIHIISDLLIWLAYVSIPVVLFWVARTRRDFPFRHLFAMFGIFIIACGFTHLLEAIIFWWPAYRFLALVKLVTAVVSVGTALVLARVMPAALSLRSPAQLREEVDRQTRELRRSEKELQAAKLAAEEANRSKSAFLANMSHEIRTPLTAILGYASVLREEAADSEAVENATTIHRNGEHLLGVLNDILDLSKIEAGKLEFEYTSLSPRRIVDECVELFEAKAKEADVELTSSVDEDVPQLIHCDAVRTRQVLLNLLSNAVKFTPKGTVDLRVSVDPEATDVIRFDVIDSGIGMARECQEHVFEAFQQAEVSTSRRFGGTGLGLTISGHIARQLGGALTLVRSEEGVGSQFRFSAPMRLESLRKQPPSSSKVPDRNSVEGLDIVLAEDSPDSHRLLRHFLSRARAVVTSVYDGVEAVEVLTQRIETGKAPSLVIMDMQMPLMDGYEATRAIRGLGYTGPVLALTAHAMDDHRARCFAAGCSAFESKPVDREKLISVVADLAESHASMRSRGDQGVTTGSTSNSE